MHIYHKKRKETHIQGNVIYFNGKQGIAIGEDGNKYHLSIENIAHSNNCQIYDSYREQLRKTNTRIEFDPECPNNNKKKPIAKNIIITESTLWKPQHTLNGFWIHDAKGFNCSACGKTSPTNYKFCPNCGAPMDRTADTNGLRDNTENIHTICKLEIETEITRNICIKTSDVQALLTPYLKNIFKNSPDLSVTITTVTTSTRYTPYILHLHNISYNDFDIIEKFHEDSIYAHSNLIAHDIDLPLDISHKLIQDCCLDDTWKIRTQDIDPSNIVFYNKIKYTQKP